MSTNPSAFPMHDVRDVMDDKAPGGWRVELQSEGGMTLRDYFAAKALAGWIQYGAVANIIAANNVSPSGALIVLSDSCYAVADAMLVAREAKR